MSTLSLWIRNMIGNTKIVGDDFNEVILQQQQENQPPDTVKLERLKKVFQKYASHFKGGTSKSSSQEMDMDSTFMDVNDFVKAISPSIEFYKVHTEQYAVLFRLCDNYSTPVKVILHREIAQIKAALNREHIKGDRMSFQTFKDCASQLINGSSSGFDFDSSWIQYFVAGGKKDISYPEFCQLIKSLQEERLRQEFKTHDRHTNGYIEVQDFVKIIRNLERHKLSPTVDQHLATIGNLSSSNHITFAQIDAFHSVIRQMDAISRIAKRAIAESSDGRITKTDFVHTAQKLTRFSIFTPMEVDIIFHFAGLRNNTNRLSLKDFEILFDPKWEKYETTELSTMDNVEEKHSSALAVGKELIKSAYNFAVGSIAGAIGATVVYPIDLVKTRMQNQRSAAVGELLYRNSLDCFQKVIRGEGILGLYHGLLPQLVGVAPEKAIKLTMNDFVRSRFTNKETGRISLPAELLAGATAGACQVVFTNPLEIVKIRLQIQGEMVKLLGAGSQHRQSAIQIVKQLGLLGLYKGASACLLRDIPFSAIYFPVYFHLKKDFFGETPKKKLNLLQLLGAGAAAGMPAAYLTTPADVIKTRLQVEARQGQSTYSGITDAFIKIWREEGPKALFKGGPARILRSSPQFGVTLMSYELIQRFFSSNNAAMAMAPLVNSREEELFFLKSKNAIKLLMDIDYQFGVFPSIFTFLNMTGRPTILQKIVEDWQVIRFMTKAGPHYHLIFAASNMRSMKAVVMKQDGVVPRPKKGWWTPQFDEIVPNNTEKAPK